jgi:hypothetical protein
LKKFLVNLNLFLLLIISGCYYTVQTQKKYDESNRAHHLITKPIYFLIKDQSDPKSSAYFLLYYNISSNKYYLKLKWLLYANQRPYIKLRDSLKFSLDNLVELSLSSLRPPKVTRISLEPKGTEEEIVYEIDRPTLEIIAQAGKVDLEVRSRVMNLKGYFMKQHSFNAVAEFLDTVDKEVNED